MKKVLNSVGVVSLALVLFFIMSIMVALICVVANGGHLNFATNDMTSVQTIAFNASMFLMSAISIALSNRIINGKWFEM